MKQVLSARMLSGVIVEGPAGAIHRHPQDAPDALLLDLMHSCLARSLLLSPLYPLVQETV